MTRAETGNYCFFWPEKYIKTAMEEKDEHDKRLKRMLNLVIINIPDRGKDFLTFLTFRHRLPVRDSRSCTDFSISHGQWPMPP